MESRTDELVFTAKNHKRLAMKRQSAITVVAISIAWIAGGAAHADYIETMNRAEKLEEAGDLVGATKTFIQATREGSDSPISAGYAQGNLGKFYARHGQYDYAEKCLLYAIQLDKKAAAEHKQSSANLSKTLQNRKPSSNPLMKALEDRSDAAIKRLIELDQTGDQAHLFGDEAEHTSDLAMVFYLRKNKPKAEELWIKAIKLDPRIRTSLEELADRTNWKKRDPEKSVVLWREALAIRKKAIPTPHAAIASNYGYLGNVLFHNLNKTKEAEVAYKTSIGLWKGVKIKDYLDVGSKWSMLQMYAKLLDRTDRYEEAAKVRAEVAALKQQEIIMRRQEEARRRG